MILCREQYRFDVRARRGTVKLQTPAYETGRGSLFSVGDHIQLMLLTFHRWVSNRIEYCHEQGILSRRITAQRAYLKSRGFTLREVARVTQCEEIQSASKFNRYQ